jgi:hypothetical protein
MSDQLVAEAATLSRDIHDSFGVRSRITGKRATAALHIRPQGQLDGLQLIYTFQLNFMN